MADLGTTRCSMHVKQMDCKSAVAEGSSNRNGTPKSQCAGVYCRESRNERHFSKL